MMLPRRARQPLEAHKTARPAGPVLRAASQLCTDFGRVSDLEELKTLVGHAADLMDASGLVVWVTSADGAELQPALSHGYAPQVLARMPAIPRSADNAAAAAVRTSQLQIVLARPGSSNGAVVAPIAGSPDGCVGALSAEIRGGGETSESVQALRRHLRRPALRRPAHDARVPRTERLERNGTISPPSAVSTKHDILQETIADRIKDGHDIKHVSPWEVDRYLEIF